MQQEEGDGGKGGVEASGGRRCRHYRRDLRRTARQLADRQHGCLIHSAAGPLSGFQRPVWKQKVTGSFLAAMKSVLQSNSLLVLNTCFKCFFLAFSCIELTCTWVLFYNKKKLKQLQQYKETMKSADISTYWAPTVTLEQHDN